MLMRMASEHGAQRSQEFAAMRQVAGISAEVAGGHVMPPHEWHNVAPAAQQAVYDAGRSRRAQQRRRRARHTETGRRRKSRAAAALRGGGQTAEGRS